MNEPVYILGISAYFHDSAACLLKDNEVIAAAQEERFTRVKHDASYPVHAIDYCLKEAQIERNQVLKVVFYEKPILKFERILKQYFLAAPFGLLPFIKAIKVWLNYKLWISKKIRSQFGKTVILEFAKHHESHAASSCFTAPFSEGAFIVLDGVGEWATTSIGTFLNGKLQVDQELKFPHSIGLLYSAFTQYCGFKVNSGEYKLMGLAPYGNPKFESLILKELIHINDDYSYELNLRYFHFHKGQKMINSKFENLFGFKARNPSETIIEHYKDVAASIQAVLEKYIAGLIKYTSQKYNSTQIAYSGGVALNCLANGTFLAENPTMRLWIHPASGDAGGALGAALLGRRDNQLNISLSDVFLGPSFNAKDIERAIRTFPRLKFHKNDSIAFNKIAQLLAEDKVVGWFQNKMEWGPRALGNRSILASPVSSQMQKHLNLAIKKREDFRPFAPVILAEKQAEWFTLPIQSPYMLFTSYCKKPAEIKACVHVNNTARLQSVSKSYNPKLHALLEAFYAITSVPILINTSFNERGEPIVCSPKDAIHCFLNTEMDVLVLENYLFLKEENQFNWKEVKYELD